MYGPLLYFGPLPAPARRVDSHPVEGVKSASHHPPTHVRSSMTLTALTWTRTPSGGYVADPVTVADGVTKTWKIFHTADRRWEITSALTAADGTATYSRIGASYTLREAKASIEWFRANEDEYGVVIP